MNSSILIISLALLIVGCSNESSTPANLKPVAGAFGYVLSETNQAEIQDQTITDMPPFNLLSVDKLSDGRICQISAFGIVEGYDTQDNRKRLIAVLTEKYGERQRISGDIAATANEIHYFGTTNRAVSVSIEDEYTNATFTIKYYDPGLMHAYWTEQNAKDQVDEKQKKASLANGL